MTRGIESGRYDRTALDHLNHHLFWTMRNPRKGGTQTLVRANLQAKHINPIVKKHQMAVGIYVPQGASGLRHIWAATARTLEIPDATAALRISTTVDRQAGHSSHISDAIYAQPGELGVADGTSRIASAYHTVSVVWHEKVLGLQPVPAGSVPPLTLEPHARDSATLAPAVDTLDRFERLTDVVLDLQNQKTLLEQRVADLVLENASLTLTVPTMSQPSRAHSPVPSFDEHPPTSPSLSSSSPEMPPRFDLPASGVRPKRPSTPERESPGPKRRRQNEASLEEGPTTLEPEAPRLEVTTTTTGEYPQPLIQALRAHFGDASATFKAPTQAHATQLLLERAHHILYIAPTAEGKTLPITLALRVWPQRVKILFVVPFVTLYDHMRERFAAAGLPAQVVHADDALADDVRVWIVGANAITRRRLCDQLRQRARRGEVGAVMYDEADGVVNDAYRPELKGAVLNVVSLAVPIIFTTATIPEAFTKVWMRVARVSPATPNEPSPVVVVRNRDTSRLNIRYEFCQYDGEMDGFTRVRELCASPIHGRTLVLTTYPATAASLAEFVKTSLIITGDTTAEDRVKALATFGEDPTSILVGTKAAYYGANITTLRHVVLLFPFGGPFGLDAVDFLQASGRAGRGAFPALCTVLHPREPPAYVKSPVIDFGGAHVVAQLLGGTECPRTLFWQFLDGWQGEQCPQHCGDLNARLNQLVGSTNVVYVLPCSRCAKRVDMALWRPLPTLPSPPPTFPSLERQPLERWTAGLFAPAASEGQPTFPWGTFEVARTGPTIHEHSSAAAEHLHTLYRLQSFVEEILAATRGCFLCFERSGDAFESHSFFDCTHSRDGRYLEQQPSSQHAPRFDTVVEEGKVKYRRPKKGPIQDAAIDLPHYRHALTEYAAHSTTGICFACSLPEHEFHPPDDPAFDPNRPLGQFKPQCVVRSFAAALSIAWSVRRHPPTFRSLYRTLTDLQAPATDDDARAAFDQLTFSLLDEGFKGLLVGTSIFWLEWWHTHAQLQLPQFANRTELADLTPEFLRRARTICRDSYSRQQLCRDVGRGAFQ